MRASVIDDAFAPVLDQVFQKLQRLRHLPVSLEKIGTRKPPHLVYLPPLTGLLLHKARVDSGHDLIELLTGNIIEKAVDLSDIRAHKLNVLDRSDWRLLVELRRGKTVSRHTLGQSPASGSSSLPFRST